MSSVSLRGLTEEQVRERLARHGANEIVQAKATPAWKTFAQQFKSPVVALLAAACLASAFLGERADAIAIGSIVFLNAMVGFLQEFRAEKAVLALRSMTAPRARVVRAGRLQMIPSANVVPGDVLALEAGDLIAADARLLEAHELSTNEAVLTGESLPVQKSTSADGPDATLAERRDLVFMGTAVASGTGLAEVSATGMSTEFGKIAHLIDTAEQSITPLQRHLATVSRSLILLCIAVVVVTAGIGLARGNDTFDVFMSAVSLAVAAVPEGLPTIVTIALALGVQRMAARRSLVRKLPAVETLGSVTVICTDKTGTLTTGSMAVRELWASNETELIDAAAACCDAELGGDGRSGTGDPTELALLQAAAERGITRAEIERSRPTVSVHPFDPARKRMSIERADGRLYVKGAVESVLAVSRKAPARVTEVGQQMAARGLRVLAIAYGEGDEERDLALLGLVGISDPPRPEAIEAVQSAREAGIKTVMITGDHAATAIAIARDLGIVLDGESPDGLVHARATPEDKLRIVRECKASGGIVAMTGDGINDAPALREAHIGIAMGKSGTEVTREASDIVLTDDNFASIVAAIREGRGIFDNIRKTLVYLLSGNTAELLVMLSAAVIGLPIPLLPLHLLWINLVTDGLPALALVTDPPAPNILKRPPRAPSKRMLGKKEWSIVGVVGLIEAIVTLSVFVWALKTRDLREARHLAFVTLVFSEVFRAFPARSSSLLLWEVGLFTNVRLLVVVLLTVLLQLGLQYTPWTRSLFDLSSLSLSDSALMLAASLVTVTLLELSKLVRRALRPRPKNVSYAQRSA